MYVMNCPGISARSDWSVDIPEPENKDAPIIRPLVPVKMQNVGLYENNMCGYICKQFLLETIKYRFNTPLTFGIRGSTLYYTRIIYFSSFQGGNWKNKREIEFCAICIPCISFIGANCIISLDATLPVELSSFSPLFGSRNYTTQNLISNYVDTIYLMLKHQKPNLVTITRYIKYMVANSMKLRK